MNDVTPADDRELAAEATRAANDRIAAKARRLRFAARIPFLCECSDARCRDLVLVLADAFDAVRADGRALLAADHVGGAGLDDELEQTG